MPEPAALPDGAALLGDLYARYRRPLFAYCMRGLGCTALDAEDLVQETFLRAWRGLAHAWPDCPLWLWLCRIARNARIDTARRTQRIAWVPWPEGLDVAAPDDPAAEAVAGDVRQMLQQAITLLPAKQARAVRLYYERGLTVRAIAAQVGAPENTIKTELFRGRAVLRALLAAELQDP